MSSKIGEAMTINESTLRRACGGTVVLVIALTVAACGSQAASTSLTTAPKKPGTSTTVKPTSNTTTSPASGIAALSKVGPAAVTGLTVSLAKGAQGIFLIGPNGHTLYIFTKDQGSVSACVSPTCAKAWPALRATGGATTGPSVNATEVATAHGQVTNQVTYYGHLLYYFEGDTAPGQTNGTSIPDFDLLGPFGNVMLPRP
jgi:predicted lipoprotein with Yx(FWY)xxD motif